AVGLKSVLERYRSEGGGRVVVLVGPEGGLSQESVDRACNRGFQPVSLGPRVVRTETAAIAVLSILQYTVGDMG
ncbi:MAG: RsmE family RNA methyltransferase, partial [Thermodesulfobacteriota bacterium]